MSSRRNFAVCGLALVAVMTMVACGQVDTGGSAAVPVVLCAEVNDHPDCVASGLQDVDDGTHDVQPALDDVEEGTIDARPARDVTRDDIDVRDVTEQDDAPDGDDLDDASPDADVNPDADVDPDTSTCHDDDPSCAPTCDDGVQNGDETDIDCGGTDCAPCELQERCERGVDCVSDTCIEGICVPSTCTDGVQNGNETDIDCGGSCRPCTAGQRCEAPVDCVPPTFLDWSPCGDFLSTCGESGTRTRHGVATHCVSGVCVAEPTSETGTCTRDTTDSVCGALESTEWTPCGGFAGSCGTDGTQSRTVTTYTCRNQACTRNVETESSPCTRDTEGTICGEVDNGPWSACSGFEGVCGNTGTQTREVSGYTCSSGVCSLESNIVSQACTRDTDDITCGETEIGPWTECSYGGTCATYGLRTRSVTTRQCESGACSSTIVIESETCTRDVLGTTCGTTQVGSWSACASASGDCSDIGTQSRTVTTYSCSGGTCAASSSTESRSCELDSNGATCDTTVYGSWSVCSGFVGTCGDTGTRTRAVTTRTCGDGTCNANTTMQTGTCTRDTHGVMCGTTVYGSWSDCVASSGLVCSTSGTRSRAVTTYTCAGGTCTAHATTETVPCTRYTNGMSCGDAVYGAWGPCGGFSGICGTVGFRTRAVTTYMCGSGLCQAMTTTDSEECTRATQGMTCSAVQYGSWSACSYPSTCATTGTRTRSVTTYTCSSGTCQTNTTTESGTCTRNTEGETCASTTTNHGACFPAGHECSTLGNQTTTTTTYTCNGGSCQGNSTSSSQSCVPLNECAPCWADGAGVCLAGSCRQGVVCDD